MIDRAELKELAKEHIRGNIGILFVIMLIVCGISAVVGMVPFIGWFVSFFLVTPAFSLSLVYIFLNQANGIKPDVSRAFDGFYDFWSAFKVQFFVSLFSFLWSLLLIIPGIIKGISYSMSMYILAENKGMPALEAIERSKEMMDGHKMDFFVLGLSFIGWSLLGTITFGVAYIWVLPYMNATLVNFYNKIKNEDPGEYASPIINSVAE